MLEKTIQGVGQDSVSSVVQILLRKNAVLTQAWQDVTAFAQPGDKSIAFPRMDNQFQVQKLVGSEKGDDQELVFGTDVLALTEEAHIQWVIKKFDQARSKVEILQSAVNEATIEQAISLNQDLYTEFLAGVTLTPINGVISQVNVVAMITALNTALVPADNRTFIFGVDAYGKLIGIDGFVDASKSNLDIVRTGQIGTLYGIPVLVSSVIATGTGILTHKQALAYGFGAAPAIESEPAIEYGTGSRRWVMDQLYGQKTLNKGKMGVVITGV